MMNEIIYIPPDDAKPLFENDTATFRYVHPVKGEVECPMCSKRVGCDHMEWWKDEQGNDVFGVIINPDWVVNLRVSTDKKDE